MNKHLDVLPDQTTLIRRSLEVVVEKIHGAIADRGICSLVLAGGNTPKPLYELLATQQLPWESIHLFWGDERYVPSDHPDSNQRMAQQTLLDKVAIPASNIHPVSTSEADPAIAANHYEAELQTFFQLQPGAFPSFDIVLLGIGDDGHTASLFPHTAALDVCDRLVTVGSKDGQPRITLTAACINHAQTVIFIVAGASKQPALAQIFSPTGDDFTYPARMIQPKEDLWWLLDHAAGQEMKV